MSTELESSGLHFYMISKVVNNANPSEVNEASQADSEMQVHEHLSRSRRLLDRGLSLLDEFLKRAVSSLIAVFSPKILEGSISNTD